MRSRGTLWAYTSARTKRNLAFLWTALFLCSLLVQYVSLAAPVAVLAASGLKAGTVQGFEIDGDLTSGNGASNPGTIPAALIDTLANGDDWLDGASGSGVVDPAVAPRSDLISDPAGVANDDQFIGGAKELDTCTWGFDEGPVTGKDDFRHTMAYAKFVGNSAYFYVGAERIINNGDTHIDFELNRMAWTVFPGAGGVAKPNRTVGDLILSLEFANGGSNPEMTVYRIATVTDCLNNGQKAGEEVTVTDITTTAAVHSATNFGDLTNVTFPGGSAYTIPQFEFAEAAIDLASLGIQTSCPGFSAGSVRSRAGGDISSSQLKDTADPFPIDLNNCGKIIVEKQTNPDGSSQSFHFNASYDGDGFDLQDGQQNNSGNLEPGTYSVSEVLPDNWTLTGATCDDGSSPSSIGLGPNETVTCVFNNRFLPAAVHIDKTPDGQTKNAGDTISFTLSWTNTGEGFATGVVVSDDLPDPAGVEWSISGSTGSGSTCQLGGNSSDQTLTCTIGNLAAGATGSVTLTSATTSDSCGVINNTGAITSTNDGSDTDNGQITVQCPDVRVTKTPDEPNNDIDAGDAATFTIGVENLGPGTASNVTLTDQLPAGTWTLGGANAADCSINGSNLLTCSFGTLAAGASRTITVARATTAADCGTITNTATVAAANEPAANTGNNSDPGEIDVLCAQIDIEKTANPAGPVNAGDPIGFDIVVTNNGAGEARGVTVTDALPAGFSWSEDSADCSITSNVLTCTFGDLAAGASRSVHLSTPTDAADCGLVTNTASVSTTNDGSDSDGATVVVQCPDVSVVKTADNSPISAGDTAAFTIVVSNTGLGTAKNVTLNDPLPAGVAWSEDSADCSIASNTLTCSFGDLAAGASRTIHVSGLTDAADCGTLPNTATVAATNEPASALGNNQSSASIVVQCPDVRVVKTAVDGSISSGETASFQIVVSNIGTGIARSVTLNDPLPDGIDWSEDSAQCSIAPDSGTTGQVLSCAFGDLAPGASRTITVSGETDSQDCGTLPNTATVAATNEPSSALGNNQSSASIVVDCPLLDLVKTADKATVLAGDQIGFTITVTNNGLGAAFNVNVTDTLPTDAGTAWTIDGAGSDAGWSIQGGVLTYGPATLAAGATIKVHVVSPTTPASCGEVDNTASVTTSNAGSDSDSAEVDVLCPQISIVKTAGDAADGDEYVTEPAEVPFTYVVKNTGTADLINVVIVDDNATPDDPSDDFVADCEQTTLEVGEEMTCTGTAPVSFGIRTNLAVVSANPELNPEQEVTDEDDAVVRVPQLTIDKSFTGNTKGIDPILDLPAAKEGDVLTYTLQYDLTDGPVTNGVITDVLPEGLEYVPNSATGNAEFSFTSYDATTRTLRWDAATVSADGSVAYRVIVQLGANKLPQPLVNVATIDSDETTPDDDDAKVVVPGEVLVITPTPRITPPPTDLAPAAPANPGFGLMLALLGLAGLTLAVGFLTPAPARARRRRDRR